MTLDYDTAHDYVDSHKFANWDGWDIVIWKPAPGGYSNRNGQWRGRWGIALRYRPGRDGLWRIPEKFK